jgi:hypothetical protein
MIIHGEPIWWVQILLCVERAGISNSFYESVICINAVLFLWQIRHKVKIARRIVRHLPDFEQG